MGVPSFDMFATQDGGMGPMMGRSELAAFYRNWLVEGIVPFWLQHGIDWEYGGVLTGMKDDGTVECNDKFIWSQGRSVWTFSALYNRIEPSPTYLAVARNSVEFLLQHGRDDQDRYVFRTSRTGEILEEATSIYSDCFVIYGLSEYCRAVPSAPLLHFLSEHYERVKYRVEQPTFRETAPYPLAPGRKCHGVSMILLEVAQELAKTTGNPDFEKDADGYALRIMEHFVRPKRRLLLEFLTDSYCELPPPEGTFVMPGHAIESMWFILHHAQRRGDASLIERALEVLLWHLKAGWDEVYGGLYLAIDAEGGEPFLPHATMKVWWPHTESLYATQLAYQLTGQRVFLEWYQQLHAWSFRNFKVPGCGEWRQRLNREGKPVEQVVALPVKDPFHLPRAAILITQLLSGCTARDW